MTLLDKSISELLSLMYLNEVTSEEITREYISNIEKEAKDSDIYQLLLKDQAIDKAKKIDIKRKNKEPLGSLAGIPFVITDDISTKGIPTTAGSKILENYIPPFDATVIEKLEAEDAIILGKVRVNEFGLIPSKMASEALSENGANFAITTAQDPSKFSMKPSFGMISRYGIIGATSTFEQIVAITKSVEDMGAVLNSIVGYDKRDSASINKDKVDYRQVLKTGIEGLKIAIPKGLFTQLSAINLDKIIGRLEEDGAIIQEVSIESLDYILPVYNVLSSAEFASNTARYDGISLGYRTSEYVDREDLYKKTRGQGFSKEVKKKILFGNYTLSSGQYEKYYKKAQKVRRIIKDEFTRLSNEYGLLILPFPTDGKEEPFSLVGRITGLPSITIPGGIQVLGSPFKEEDLLKVAYALENVEIREVENND